jgi:hypothetical protein
MSKSGGIKAASLFVGLLLCVVTVQTAFAQTEGKAAVMLSAPIENSTSIIDPQTYNNYLTAGSGAQFTLSFTNKGNETLTLTPKVVCVPDSEKNVDKSWVKISPASAKVAPGSKQKFDIEMNIPRDTLSGEYRGDIAFTDDLVPCSTQYANSMHLDLVVQALPKILLDTQYISDIVDAGKEYEYKIKIKNIASKDITIDPKIPGFNSFYDPSYIPAFNSDAIEISAPSTIKAGEVANMTIRVKVPENATGRYSGSINMNVDGEVGSDNTNNQQINLEFNVLKQPLAPYVKAFKTVNEKPLTVEVSAITSENPWLQAPKREKPSFNLKLSRNNSPINLTFVKSVESGNINIGGYPSMWPIDDKTIYQSFADTYVETYTVPGAAGDWEISILPKNMQSFGYSITVGDSKDNKSQY